MFHQNIQHFFIFFWQFVYQEMDSTNTGFWAPTFFKKRKKKLLAEYSESNLFLQINNYNSSSVRHLQTDSNIICHLLKEKRAIFRASLLRWCLWGCSLCLPLGGRWRTVTASPSGTLHSKCAHSSEGVSAWATAPQGHTNKAFPLTCWIVSPKTAVEVLTPGISECDHLKHIRYGETYRHGNDCHE